MGEIFPPNTKTNNDIEYLEAQRKIIEVLYIKSELPKVNEQFQKEFKYLVPSDIRNYIPILDVIIKRRVEVKYEF